MQQTTQKPKDFMELVLDLVIIIIGTWRIDTG